MTCCPAVVFYEPHLRDRSLLPHDPFKAAIAPRPIGWVSTLSADGAVNLAPYSFFNAVCGAPPMIAFSSEGMKDSAASRSRRASSCGTCRRGICARP